MHTTAAAARHSRPRRRPRVRSPDLADLLAPENMLKSSGRGIFLIRSFMDEVELQRASRGRHEIRMVKRSTPATRHDRHSSRPRK